MSYPEQSHRPNNASRAAMSLARQVGRVLTWGLPEAVRREQLAEADADWEAMGAEHSPLRLTARALRGIPGWIWTRLTVGDTTTLPAAAAIALVAMGALTASLQPAAYPNTMRFFIGITAFGLILSSYTLLRNPRRLVLRQFGVPALATAIGMIGIGIDLPEASEWPYETPLWDPWILDALVQSGLLLVGFGCGVGAINALLRRRRIAILAGSVILGGLVLFAASQIVWGIWVSSVNPALAASSIVVGLAALSWLHVMPRLRHLEFE